MDGVATRSTRRENGVEKEGGSGVDPTSDKRSAGSAESVDPGRRSGVENGRRSGVDTSAATKGRSTLFEHVERHTTTKVYDADVKRKVVLKVVHEGQTHQEEAEIRVIIDGINVLGKYNKQERDYGWFRTQKSNYEGFLRKGKRDPVTSQLRIQLFEAYMKLIEEVEQDYHDLLTQNKVKTEI